jgi:hypothetical protein
LFPVGSQGSAGLFFNSVFWSLPMLIAPKTESSPGLFFERAEIIAVLPVAGGFWAVLFRDGRTVEVAASTGEAILGALT